MAETTQQNDKTNKCCDGDEKQVCCEQMFTMMQMFMCDLKGGFDCASLMAKMGCKTPQKS